MIVIGVKTLHLFLPVLGYGWNGPLPAVPFSFNDRTGVLAYEQVPVNWIQSIDNQWISVFEG